MRNTSQNAGRTRPIYHRSLVHLGTRRNWQHLLSAEEDREHGRRDTKASCRPRQLPLLPGSYGACLSSHTEDGLGNWFGSRGCQWDRKTWSHENYFTAVGVSVDPGNHVLSIILLAIRHALGMEPLLEARACSKDLQDAALRRLAGWPDKDDHRCDRHPLLAGATAAGISRKQGYMKPVSSLIGKGASPQECLRLVLASLAHDEEGQRATLRQGIFLKAQERLGDIIEAAGGVLGTPAAKSLMASMHTAHGTNRHSDTNSLIKLSKIAVGISELTWMTHALDSSDGIDNSVDAALQMFDVLHELRVDGAALPPAQHGDQCWICAEFRRVGGDGLLITAEQKDPRKKISTKKGSSLRQGLEEREVRAKRATTARSSRSSTRPRPALTPDCTTRRRQVSSGAIHARHGFVDPIKVGFFQGCASYPSRNSWKDDKTGVWTPAGTVSSAGKFISVRSEIGKGTRAND